MLWKSIRETLPLTEFTPEEVAIFSVLVGIPAETLDAIISKDLERAAKGMTTKNFTDPAQLEEPQFDVVFSIQLENNSGPHMLSLKDSAVPMRNFRHSDHGAVFRLHKVMGDFVSKALNSIIYMK